MKTRSGWFQLRGLSLLVLGAMLCASAVAGPSATRDPKIVKQRIVQQQRPVQKRVVLVQSSVSGVPIPIEWITGIPTTATPMDIIRGH
jgi:hypothetical protein